jgi:putative lipoprotein
MSVKVLVCGVTMASSLMLPATAQAATQGMLAIEGTATYRERIALPPDAIFEATLEDTTRTGPAQVLGQTRIEQPGDPPFHFTIKYDPTQIQPTHMYSVRGRITANGRLLFATQQANQVLTQGHGSEIGMMTLQRVQSATGPTGSSAAPLQGTYWKLEAIGNQPVTAAERQREPHLIFSMEGDRLTGSGGCNRLAGSYRTDRHTAVQWHRFNQDGLYPWHGGGVQLPCGS